MAIARHGRGPVATFRALGSQIHPVFMLPPVASSWFGGVLAGGFSVSAGAIHVVAIFAAVYTAHVKDGYVDFHVRGEDDDHPLTENGCYVGLIAATVVFLACCLGLWMLVGLGAVLLTAPGWVIGYLHAPQLDMNPIGATAGYPTGIALAILGGYYVQAQTLGGIAAGFAVVFLLILTGVKVIDDATDYEYDRSIDKRTVAVVLGLRRARHVAYGLIVVGVGATVLLSAISAFPRGAVLAAGAFAVVAAVSARTTDPELATMLLIRGSYVFLAVLMVAVWYEPLAAVQ